MIDAQKTVGIIESYKQYFPEHWEDEKYKWEAVKHFQDNWDIEAQNFGTMFKKATDKTFNLLASGYAYPRGMILEFAKADDNAVREMFRRLFAESLDLSDRVTEFMNTAEKLRIKYNDGTWKQHYQNTNYISTYLWLMYPDKYYIYKYELFKKCAEVLDDTYRPKSNGAVDNVIGGYRMYDEIRKTLQADGEIRQMLQAALTGSCYPDPELVTMTIDLGFYLARYYKKDTGKDATSEEAWFPSHEEYDPQLSVEDWCALLEDPEVFDENSLTVIQCIYEMGGQATCKELSDQYGKEPGFYNIVSTTLAKRIHKKTNCPLIKDELSKNSRWWPILYRGKHAGKETVGAYIWKLRDELKMALENVLNNNNESPVNAWLLTYNPTKWNWDDYDEAITITKSGTGYLTKWNWDDCHAKVGDRVFLVKLGDNSTPKGIIATGYITSDFWEGDNFDQAKDNKIKYVDVIFTSIIDYQTDDIITVDELKERFPEQKWNPQSSGIAIKSEAAKWLIDNWNAEIEPNDNENKDYAFNKTNTSELTIDEKKAICGLYYAKLPKGDKGRAGQGYNKQMTELEIALHIREDGKETGTIIRNIRDKYDPYFQNRKGWDKKLNVLEQAILDTFKGCTAENLQAIVNAIKNNESYPLFDSYTKDDFLNDVFLTEPEYDKLRSLVLRKKNIILQGAPGVGKTFSAKRLAYSIIGEKNENRICMVQFHQNYSYEDFIMGYRPNDTGGFELQSGVFYNFCIRCKENPDKPYFFIIDEINRGNLSKIFGELLMLIETDKRGEKHKLNLVYGGTAFYIPENLHIIGMMNTADRSLAMIDYALRRRFSFYTMQPAFKNADKNGFADYTADIQCELYHSVIAKIRELNDTIRKDSTLGKGFEIGHSYFAPENKSEINDEWVRGVVEYEIIPLIEEYWFDDDKKVDEWTKALYQVLGDQNDR